MTKLDKISDDLSELNKLFHLLEQGLIEAESEEALTKELSELFEQTDFALKEKADHYAYTLQRFEGETIPFLKKRAERFNSASRRIERFCDFLRTNIKVNLQRNGLQELRASSFAFKLSKTKPSLKIDAEELIPEDFKRVETKTVVDKESLRMALEAGEIINGAHLEEGVALRIGVNNGK